MDIKKDVVSSCIACKDWLFSQSKTVLAGVALLVILIVITIASFGRSSVEEIPDFGELPDLNAYNDVDVMKAVFFDYLTPIVDYHNSQINDQRNTLRVHSQGVALIINLRIVVIHYRR